VYKFADTETVHVLFLGGFMRIDFYQQACERIEDEAESKPSTLNDYLENDLSDLSLYARILINSVRGSEAYDNAVERISDIQRRAIDARIAEEADQLADEMEAEYYEYLRDQEADRRMEEMRDKEAA